MMKGEISLSSSGVIVELKKGRVIVMTKQFDFVEIKRKPHMASGQKISFKQDDIYVKNERPLGLAVKIASIASIAAVLLLVVLNLKLLNFNKNEFAYVCLDINPSFEFIIGNEKTVIGAKAINDDAKVVMEDLDIKNENITDALKTVIRKCINAGYLTDEEDKNAVLFSVALNHKNNRTGNIEDNMKDLLSEIDSIADNYKDMNFKILKVSSEDRSAAIKAGISMGRYYLYLKAKELSINISLEQIKQKSISELMVMVDSNKLSSATDKEYVTSIPEFTPTPGNPIPSPTPEIINTNKPGTQEVASGEDSKGNGNDETVNNEAEPTMRPPEAEITKTDKPYNTPTPIMHTPRVTPTSAPAVWSTPSETIKPGVSSEADKEDNWYYTSMPAKPTPKTSSEKAYTPPVQSIRPDPTVTKPVPTNTKKSTPTPMPTPTPKPTPTSTPKPTPTPIPTSTPTVRPTPTIKPTPMPTNTPTRVPTNTPVFKPTPSPTPVQAVQVIGFTLVNAFTGKDIRKIENGEDVYLSETGGVIKIRADIEGNAEKVVFGLNENRNFASVYEAPYTVKIDNVRFSPWMQAPVEQAITAVPYYRVNGVETEGQKLSIKINIKEYKPIQVSKDLKITGFVLVDSNDGRDIREISDGEYINIAEVGKTIKIRAKVTDNVQKVNFFMDQGMKFKSDESAPYTFEIDTTSLYNMWGPPWEYLVIKATPISNVNGEETFGDTEVIKINIKYDIPQMSPPIKPF